MPLVVRKHNGWAFPAIFLNMSAEETHLRGIERQPSRTELIQISLSLSLSDLHGALEFWIADNVKVVRC